MKHQNIDINAQDIVFILLLYQLFRDIEQQWILP